MVDSAGKIRDKRPTCHAQTNRFTGDAVVLYNLLTTGGLGSAVPFSGKLKVLKSICAGGFLGKCGDEFIQILPELFYPSSA